MSSSHPNASVGLATVVVDELVRGGVTRFVLAPGSRSAALARAVEEHPQTSLAVMIDERSAAFFALGAARMSGSPAAVITTSGTAVANLSPAAVEADASGVPLILLTADRPPELRLTGANQTIDQIKLFGEVVRWFWDAGPAEDRPESNAYWRASVARGVSEARGWSGRPGPVHLNLAFREPTVPAADDGRTRTTRFRSSTEGRPGGTPWVQTQGTPGVDLSCLGELEEAQRGVIVVGEGADGSEVYGQLAQRLGWPLIAEGLSGARRPPSISTFHHLLQGSPPALRPDLVLRFGTTGLSPNLSKLLSDPSITQVVIGSRGGWADPDRAVSKMVSGAPAAVGEALLERLGERTGNDDWLGRWMEAERVCRMAVDEILDRDDVPSEPRTARDLAALPLDGLVVGSSMPVRDVDWFAHRTPPNVIGNRGASGIDGLVSTALGAAWQHPDRVVCLTGDLALLHDSNGFLLARRPSCVLVVINNNGGGIFNFLPQARYPHFEKLFGTPHGRDFQRLASFHELGYRRLERASDLASVVDSSLGEGGVWLVEVRTDREENLHLHRRVGEETSRRVAGVLD
ncbi:MAG: 2-succinyl-5-enolpyruvyl-6-hydroxy-3-cyclohexene-1-carboxylic-acid synthase [bacterium]|nr:2-succinyl-5-enolpyruvyl-6-hydroxy-3-cyclohexene-1-carboxylic-acid synthase [Acidimicrobiia bacterium]MCY4649543.1 2-succinyl-5-enolpyruvyl-6-hydroxy-3-cyclohexene-1-carboxylic-acid synthase [bacterium]